MSLYANLDSKQKRVVEKPTAASVDKAKSSELGIDIPLYQSTIIPVELGGLIEIIHKAMRQSPSAAASYRLSSMEKKRLEVTLFELKMRSGHSAELEDIRTNENEVVRIAVNHILNDYNVNGDESLLVKTLLSLRS